jgi:hypothetical protein
MASNAASSMQCSANGTETARAVDVSLGCDDRLIVGAIAADLRADAAHW